MKPFYTTHGTGARPDQFCEHYGIKAGQLFTLSYLRTRGDADAFAAQQGSTFEVVDLKGMYRVITTQEAGR